MQLDCVDIGSKEFSSHDAGRGMGCLICALLWREREGRLNSNRQRGRDFPGCFSEVRLEGWWDFPGSQDPDRGTSVLVHVLNVALSC